jgi:hypothetical protein
MKQPPKKKSARSPSSPKAASTKMLTRKLQELSLDIVDSNLKANGEVEMITRAELLATEIWDAACGVKHKEDGTIVFTHQPIPWAVATVFERLEGKVVPRAQDTTNRPKLGKRIEEQQSLKMKNLKHDD